MNILENKKALSAVVATVVLIGLAVALAALIMGIIVPWVQGDLNESTRCFDIQGKLHFDYENTCWHSNTNTIDIYLSQEDITLDGALIKISYESGSDKVTLNNVNGDPLKLPGKEAGKKYTIDVEEKPNQIELAPIIGGKSCDVVDGTYNIRTCFP